MSLNGKQSNGFAHKVITLDALSSKIRAFRARKKKVVLCHGVFDLIHNGHIRHLQRAKAQGDVLVVTITGDEYVGKGPGRPVFNEDLRAEVISALQCVDYVAINYAPTSINVIKTLKPTVYAKGSDYKLTRDDPTGNITHERSAVQNCGGRVVYTDEITFSSSQLLNEYFGVFPDETKRYLTALKRKYTAQGTIEKLRKLKKLKVLVVGDAIIDEYHYTTQLGATGKGNIMAVKYDHRERFAGGAVAAANHIAGFVKEVTLVTLLGTRDSYEKFICSKLAKNIKPVFFYLKGAPTVTKRRYVDSDMAKLFEVYFFRDEPLPKGVESQVCSWLNRKVRKTDICVVPDFGNGFISPAMIKILSARSRFLAVNTQINSGNRGYHVITRYPKANFISLNEPELRLASHNRYDSLHKVAIRMAKSKKASSIAVTRGTKGAILYDVKRAASYQVPALSTIVVDRIGAGDSFLSLASLCLGGGIDSRLAAFVASAAAALDVQIVCNREPVRPSDLFKYITTLLK